MPPQISLRAFRIYQNLTLADLAKLIRKQGVPITAAGLNNAELGRKPASEVLLQAWVKALLVDRRLVNTGPDLIEWVNAVQDEQGCTCGAGLPRNRRMAGVAA